MPRIQPVSTNALAISLGAALLLYLASAGSCQLDTETQLCESGIRCPENARCTAFGDGCTTTNCGNGVVDPGEICDDGNINDTDNCVSDCRSSATCGNGSNDFGEICDDGNNLSGDGCSADCLSREVCGNGYLDSVDGEACDDGNNDSGDGCSGSCQLETCGDGVRDIGEVCDDGNNTSGDGCRMDCLSNEECGNLLVDTAVGEECDSGGADTIDCDRDCTLQVCGDLHANQVAGEVCDTGGNSSICDSDCTLPVCGDGHVNPLAGEECDDGNTADGDGCDGQCLNE